MNYELISESFPVARKNYKCIWCGEDISKGVKHCHEVSKYDGLQDHRWHLECYKAGQKYFQGPDGEETFEPFVNERPK